jgi:hypothetical protein
MSKCPYCNIEVSETAIEIEDGCCPECGAMISAPDLGMGDDEYDDEDEFDYGDDQEDIFGDLADDDEFQRVNEFEDDDFGDLDEEFDEEFDDEEFEDDEE